MSGIEQEKYNSRATERGIDDPSDVGGQELPGGIVEVRPKAAATGGGRESWGR